MDDQRVAELIREIYAQLRQQASRDSARAHLEISPTSVVHETVLRLYRQAPDRWTDERHFRATAAIALKQVLIDHLRKLRADKRAPEAERDPTADPPGSGSQHDVVLVAQVLEALDEEDPRAGRVAALKLLGELENQEIADALGISRATVDRDWKAARALLAAWRAEAGG